MLENCNFYSKKVCFRLIKTLLLLFVLTSSNFALGQYDSSNVSINIFYEPIFEEEIEYNEADTLTDLMSIVESSSFNYTVSLEVEDTINISLIDVTLYGSSSEVLGVHSFTYDQIPTNNTFSFERIEFSMFIGMGEYNQHTSHSCDVTITDINGVASPVFQYIFEDEE